MAFASLRVTVKVEKQFVGHEHNTMNLHVWNAREYPNGRFLWTLCWVVVATCDTKFNIQKLCVMLTVYLFCMFVEQTAIISL
jgi:hypothetical protein